MNLKNVFLVISLVVQVRCDCDDYFKCLSGFVGDFFGVNTGRNESDSNVDNETEILDFETIRNRSVNVFDLSDIGRSLSEALTNVTTLIKDEIKGLFSIDDQTDVHKDIENKTEIHVRAFSLSKINNNSTESNGTDTLFKIPEVIINNLTKFNDELNALKVEIEKNLQAELESFISQVLENDTVDWIDVTDNTWSEFGTTEKPYPDFENDIETTTLVFDKNEDNINFVTGGLKENDNFTKTQSESHVRDTKSSKNKMETNFEITKTINVSTSDVSKSINSMIFTTPTVATSAKPKVISTTEKKAKITDFTTTTSTAIPKTATSIISTTIFPTSTVKSTKTNNITTTTISPATTKTTEKVLTKKSKKYELNKIQETQTKAPINYKAQENVKDNEISQEDLSYYEIQDDNNTDYPIIDYAELYKDTTNEDIGFIPTAIPDIIFKNDQENVIQNGDEFNKDNAYYTNDTSHPSSIFSWVAAIFIKNGSNNQFDYYCNGILLSKSVVLTSARCVQQLTVTVSAGDILVFLGKRSLQASGDEEAIHKVKQLTLHSNFSLQGDVAHNDLAVLRLEEPAKLSELIQPACLSEEESQDAVTTAWAESLSLIRFEEKNKTCEKNPVENTFCATYGLTVALCPSYGGAYATKQTDRWCLAGVRSADPSTRGLCFDKTVAYTDLRAHRTWLDDVMK